MIVDADGRRAFALAGRKTIEERFSFAARMQRMAELYDELLGNGAPEGAR
jgi:hypothetical protein